MALDEVIEEITLWHNKANDEFWDKKEDSIARLILHARASALADVLLLLRGVE